MKKEVYLVWQNAEDEQFFNQYDSLEDAVASEENPVEVYLAKPKMLGTFKVATKVVKSRKGKKLSKSDSI